MENPSQSLFAQYQPGEGWIPKIAILDREMVLRFECAAYNVPCLSDVAALLAEPDPAFGLCPSAP